MDWPERGIFDLEPDYAVPFNITKRGALETQVRSTDSISNEGRPRLATKHLRELCPDRWNYKNMDELIDNPEQSGPSISSI